MKLTQTSYVILGLLSLAPSGSGYDIRKAVEETVGYFWSESYGQIYPTLKRLTQLGLIVPVKAVSADKRRRQEYSLTKAGHACLKEWLAIPFQNDPPRNEFLLKLFFGREASPSVAMAHVRDCNEKNRRMLAILKGFEKMAQQQKTPSPHQPYWMLTLSLGVALTQTALQWGESALVTLAALENTSEADAPQVTEMFEQ